MQSTESLRDELRRAQRTDHHVAVNEKGRRWHGTKRGPARSPKDRVRGRMSLITRLRKRLRRRARNARKRADG